MRNTYWISIMMVLLLTGCREASEASAPGPETSPSPLPAASTGGFPQPGTPEATSAGALTPAPGSSPAGEFQTSPAGSSPAGASQTAAPGTAGQDGEAAHASVPEGYRGNTTLKDFIRRGYEVQEKHIFTRYFEGIGERTVIPVARFTDVEQFPVSLLVLGGERDQVLTPSSDNIPGFFYSFDAISFRDVDSESLKTGYEDITFLTSFVTGVGREGAVPFSRAYIFRNDTWGSFIEDTYLEERIMELQTERSLTMAQVMKWVRPFEYSSLAGSFNRSYDDDNAGSLVEIHDIGDDGLVFSLDAFYNLNGTPNVGRIERGTARWDQPYTAIYESETSAFKLTFRFYSPDLFQIVEEGTGEFGFQVSAQGSYSRMKLQ